MSYPRYPKYKDSGVEWLGEVPEGWGVVSLFSVAGERKQPNRGMLEHNLLSLSYGNIVRKDIESSDGLLPESFETYQIVEKNDVVFRLTDLQNDKRSLRTGIVRERGIITSAYTSVIPEKIAPTYFAYLLRAYDQEKVFYSMGGGLRQTLKYSDAKWLPILLPEAAEQQAIAAFLDRETTKIDVLIAEQEKLATLLQEKRQAVISHAVTKGLNPDAPMKDSGVEWLGEIPSNWGVARFKHCANIAEGLINPTEIAQENKILIAPDHIEKGTGRIFALETAEQQGAISNKYTVSAGQIIYSKIRPALNKLCIAQGDWLCSADMYPLTPTDDCLIEFLFYYMLSPVFVSYAQLISDRVAMPKINREQLSVVCVLLPPISEQQTIAAFLDAEIAKIDALITESKKAVELLKERRSALISAAVTGKIDVRNIPLQEAV